MADTDNIAFNKPADRLITAIQAEHERMDGKTLSPDQLLKEATAVLRRRLNVKGKVK